MATAQPLFSERLRDAVERKLNERVIENKPLLKHLMAKGRIKFGRQVKDVTKKLHLNESTHALRTFDRFTPLDSTEKEQAIEARYQHGQYFDEEPISALDEILNVGDDSQIFDNVKELVDILMNRVMHRYAEVLRTGDGTAVGTGEGTGIVGLNNILGDSGTTPAVTTYAGIAYAGNPSYAPVVVDASAIGSGFQANPYQAVSEALVDITRRSGMRDADKPDIGFASEADVKALRNEFFTRGNGDQGQFNTGAMARMGSLSDVVDVDGTLIFPDPDVRANTIELINTNSMEIWTPFDRLFKLQEKPAHNIVGTATVLEVLNVSVLIVSDPRINGLLENTDV